MDTFLSFVRAIPWYAWVAIVAIFCGTAKSIISANHRHVQKMEMIKRGMDPSKIKGDEGEA